MAGLPEQFRGYVLAPLLLRGRAVGALLVYEESEDAFHQRDLDNFGILASQLAIGVEKTMLYEEVQRLSITDGLTGLFVHRYLQERLDEELRRATRYGS